MQVKKLAEEIFIITDFMSFKECLEWIKFSEECGYELAKINMGFKKQVLNQAVRNNERVIYDSKLLANQLWERIKPYIVVETENGLACGLNERFRFYKYRKGQQFRAHRDGSFIRNIKEWSSYTLLIYLNEEMEGGETSFQNFSIQPKTGMAVLFKHEIRHGGGVIKAGVKYVLRTDVMYRQKELSL